MSNSTFEVIGIGNAIVDILANVSDDFIVSRSLNKSEMHLCDERDQLDLFQLLDSYAQAPGGSAANTIATLSGLGASCGFIGCVGNDTWGKFFEEDMYERGTSSFLVRDDDTVTGSSIVLITPDSERTMHTHLGAAALPVADTNIALEGIASSRMMYLEGYAYDTPEQKHAAEKAIETVHTNEDLFVLSLSDPGCVARHREDFASLVARTYITFGNESEFCELFGVDDQHVTYGLLESFRSRCGDITVVTQSERGCTVMTKDEIFSVRAQPVEHIDLTGAGDQFAAGFLYGVVNSRSLHDCAYFGTTLASHVISHLGPRIELSELSQFSQKFNNV